MARAHRLQVRLSGTEFAALKTRAAEAGMTMAGVVRAAVVAPEPPEGAVGAPTRESVLRMLDSAARGGSVTAMATLARELRLRGDVEPAPAPGPVDLADLAPGELRAVVP